MTTGWAMAGEADVKIISTATHFLLRSYKEDGVILVEPEEDRRLSVTP